MDSTTKTLRWLLPALTAVCVHSQTMLNLSKQSTNIDFTGAAYTRPVKSGAALPASCGVGELFFLPTATPGANLYTCVATNTWSVESGWKAAIASDVEAQNGVSNAKVMTPLRTAQAVAALCALPAVSGNAGTHLFTDGSATFWTRHLKFAPSPAQVLNGSSSAIAADRYYVQVSPDAAYALHSTPTIADGEDGQFLVITNVSLLYGVTLQDEAALAGSNLRLGEPSLTVGPRQSLRLVYNSALGDWVKADLGGPATVASQAEAEAGVENTRMMTPLRTRQSIAANALPAQAGSGGKFLTTDGTNVSWAALNTLQTGFRHYTAARCQNAVASAGFSLPASGAATPACATGADTPATVMGLLEFSDSATQEAQDHFTLPLNWVEGIDLALKWRSGVADAGKFVNWQIQGKCVADGETVSGVEWNLAQAIKDANKETVNQENDAALAGVGAAGCAAGEEFYFRFFRDPAHADDDLGAVAELISLRFAVRRTQ